MEIVYAPDSRLRTKTRPVKKVTRELKKTITEMVKLAKSFKDPEGVGLAATQIGHLEQYFISKSKDGIFQAVFNPRIIKSGKKTKVFFEGCLSIPDYYGEITRKVQITVSYLDLSGSEVTKKLTGMEAWIFQHEYDHLQGKLFIDHVLEQGSRLFKVVGRDRAGAEIFEEIKLT